MIMDYNGTTKTAVLAETLGAAIVAGDYTIPANLTYVLGTLSTAPPLLSISVWRDKKRYDYRDVRPTSLTLDMPVANEANQVFPSLEAQFKGIVEAVTDESAPVLPNAMLATRSEEHTSELQSLMRISYAVFCLKKKKITH